jgi:hypothetical protein
MGSANSKRQRHGRDKLKGLVQQNLQQFPTGRQKTSAHSIPNNAHSGTDAADIPPAEASAPEFIDEEIIITESITIESVDISVATEPHPASGVESSSQQSPNRYTAQRTPTPPNELTGLLDSLRELFVRDRNFASRPDAGRCGICYLAFPVSELEYREEDGFYICSSCGAALGMQHIPMLHRQRH